MILPITDAIRCLTRQPHLDTVQKSSLEQIDGVDVDRNVIGNVGQDSMYVLPTNEQMPVEYIVDLGGESRSGSNHFHPGRAEHLDLPPELVAESHCLRSDTNIVAASYETSSDSRKRRVTCR